jgi:hypothetical protein
MGSNHAERQGEGEGTTIKCVIGEELQKKKNERKEKESSFVSANRT